MFKIHTNWWIDSHVLVLLWIRKQKECEQCWKKYITQSIYIYLYDYWNRTLVHLTTVVHMTLKPEQLSIQWCSFLCELMITHIRKYKNVNQTLLISVFQLILIKQKTVSSKLWNSGINICGLPKLVGKHVFCLPSFSSMSNLFSYEQKEKLTFKKIFSLILAIIIYQVI